MSTNTANLNLIKPAQEDFYNVDDFNENFQKLDDFVGRKDNPHDVTAQQTGAINASVGVYANDLLEDFYDVRGVVPIAAENHSINAPENTSWGVVIPFVFSSTKYRLVIDYHGRMWLNSHDGTTWHGWTELYSTANKPTPEAIGAFPLTGGKVNGEIATPEYYRLTGYKLLTDVDLNTVKYTGQYGVTMGCPNHPTGVGYGMLEVIMYSSHWFIQRFTSISDKGVIDGIWYRTYYNNSTWTKWEKIDMRTANTLAEAEVI